MKKIISMFLASFLLVAVILTGSPRVHAASKTADTRAVAIVFDNSGSMYINGEQAWCRATYAMEVFASMLNKGDTLYIYPMHPITIDGKEYTMDKPFKLTDASQASKIRDIYTPDAQGTPIESIDRAVSGMKAESAVKKYVIVLTDGDVFYKNNKKMSTSNTKKELDSRFKEHASSTLTMMYLGIGKNVIMPDTSQSEYFVKKQAKNSEDTLSALTDMCNQIFGRDTMPKNHVTEKKIDFDISISKLIVFVQGENVSNLKVSGSGIGKQLSSASTKYGTAGCGNYKSVPDKSLQGMMVTYSNCASGSYNLEYSGKATSIEVYYEPNADLDFVFTDADGNNVDPNALYEGEYKVSFGMKDAKTGKLISSDLLGDPKYKGSYSINGKEYSIEHSGNSGEVPISLKMNDSFDANLTVTYLSGYTISKDSTDFGWPKGGIKVAARPAGKLKLEISGGDNTYPLQDLEKGTPFIAKLYYKGEQLKGKELESVKFKWETENSNATIEKTFAEDHFKLSLRYKDPKAPQDTECGGCTVPIYAYYAAKGSSQAQASANLIYRIEDNIAPLRLDITASQDYIVIKELKDSKEIIVTLKMDGKSLSAQEFDAVKLTADCSGIEHTLTPDKENSCYRIKLLPTDGIKEDDYPIKVTATHTDRIGRESQTEAALAVTLSNIPLWIKWLIWIAIIVALIIIIILIARIRVLPSKKKMCEGVSRSLHIGGQNVTKAPTTILKARRVGKTIKINAGTTKKSFTVNISGITPGADSFLYKKSQNRSFMIDPNRVSASGKITQLSINGVRFLPEKGSLKPKDKDLAAIKFTNDNLVKIQGIITTNGVQKNVTANVPISFKNER